MVACHLAKQNPLQCPVCNCDCSCNFSELRAHFSQFHASVSLEVVDKRETILEASLKSCYPDMIRMIKLEPAHPDADADCRVMVCSCFIFPIIILSVALHVHTVGVALICSRLLSRSHQWTTTTVLVRVGPARRSPHSAVAEDGRR